LTAEYDPRIECVARALCQADGKNPNAEHQTHETTRVGAAYQFGPKSIPNWYDYATEAKKFVAAFEALHENS
jgi:hypothetical protein